MSFIGGPGAPPPPSQLGRLHAEAKERQLSDAAARYAAEHPHDASEGRHGRIHRAFSRLASRLRKSG